MLPIAEWIVRTKTSARMFSTVAHIQLICLIYSLISRVTALHRAFVLMQVSSGGLLESVSVLICIFTFKLQSESTAKIFTFLVIAALLILVYIILVIYTMLCNTWFYILHSVLYKSCLFSYWGERRSNMT